MREHEVIADVVIYLIKKENATIEKVSLARKAHDRTVIRRLRRAGISSATIRGINFTRGEEDILAHYKFRTGRRQKVLNIEAKGGGRKGDVYYNLYTALGQFVCAKQSPSSYYWYAFAFPDTWRETIRRYLKAEDGGIKPIIELMIKQYTKHGQGLWFYFVAPGGIVTKETWRQTLR